MKIFLAFALAITLAPTMALAQDCSDPNNLPWSCITVPEPGSLGLLALGAGALGVLATRRRKN